MRLRCTEPSKPSCVDYDWTFEDQFQFNSCRNEIEQYAEEIDDFADCLVRRSRQLVEEQNQELSETIEKFNCKAEGNLYCY